MYILGLIFNFFVVGMLYLLCNRMIKQIYFFKRGIIDFFLLEYYFTLEAGEEFIEWK